MQNDTMYRETQDDAAAQHASQRKAGPAAQTELQDPLPYLRHNNREAPLARIAFNMQLAINGS